MRRVAPRSSEPVSVSQSTEPLIPKRCPVPAFSCIQFAAEGHGPSSILRSRGCFGASTAFRQLQPRSQRSARCIRSVYEPGVAASDRSSALARIQLVISLSTQATTFVEMRRCPGNAPRCSSRQMVERDRPVMARTDGKRKSRSEAEESRSSEEPTGGPGVGAVISDPSKASSG
jgi:hypothetical protein